MEKTNANQDRRVSLFKNAAGLSVLRTFVLTFTFFSALPAALSFAADGGAVERPVYSAGDSWTFTNDKGGTSTLEFVKEENSRYVFRRGSQEVMKDFNLAAVDTGDGYPGPMVKFPLKKGAWWKVEFKAALDPSMGTRNPQRIARYEVTEEQVTVKAGTFRAFRIDVTKEVVQKAGATRTIGSAIYWYAPEVKQIIKGSEENRPSWELTSYSVK